MRFHVPKRLLLLALVLAPSLAQACSTPVFRYALERWPPDYYRVVVFHKGELTAEQKEVTDWIADCATGEEMEDIVCNADVRTVDLDGEMSPVIQKLWESCKSDELPRLVALYPVFSGIEAPVHAGRLTAAAARGLMDSPVRRDLVKRLVGGDTAVWLFLESGDEEQDAAAKAALEEHLAAMEKELELPPQPGDMMDPREEPADEDGKYDGKAAAEEEEEEGAGGMKIAFSIVSISRETEAEKGFVGMLLGTEADLKDFKEPIVFPVFGRGRVLCALVGKGINEENIWDIGGFLCGPCACQVKAQNPGTDMLLAAAWDASIDVQEVPDIELPALTGDYGSPVEETIEQLEDDLKIGELPDVPDLAVEAPKREGSSTLHTTLIATGAGIALAGLAAILFLRSRQGS